MGYETMIALKVTTSRNVDFYNSVKYIIVP